MRKISNHAKIAGCRDQLGQRWHAETSQEAGHRWRGESGQRWQACHPDGCYEAVQGHSLGEIPPIRREMEKEMEKEKERKGKKRKEKERTGKERKGQDRTEQERRRGSIWDNLGAILAFLGVVYVHSGAVFCACACVYMCACVCTCARGACTCVRACACACAQMQLRRVLLALTMIFKRSTSNDFQANEHCEMQRTPRPQKIIPAL